MTKSNLEKRIYFTLGFRSVTEGSQSRNRRQELRQRLWGSTVCWPAQPVFLDHLGLARSGAAHNEFSPYLSQEHALRACPQTSVVAVVSVEGPVQSESSLCEMDIDQLVQTLGLQSRGEVLGSVQSTAKHKRPSLECLSGRVSR